MKRREREGGVQKGREGGRGEGWEIGVDKARLFLLANTASDKS